MKKKIALTILILFLASGAFASSVQIHPPWSQDGNVLYVSAFGKDRYLIVKTKTSAAINAAIDALGTEGGEVYLPEGTYAITTQIAMDVPNITLNGSGPGTILQLGADIIGIYVYHATTSPDGCTISNLTFDGQSTAQSANYSLIRAVDINNLTIRNVHFKNFEEEALYIQNGNQQDDSSVVENCIFEDSADASSYALRYKTQGTAGGTLHVTNTEFKDCDIGIYVESGKIITQNCKFSNSTDYSIYTVSAGPFGCSVSECIFYSGSSIDIYLLNVLNWTLSNNIFIDSGNSCIYIDNGTYHIITCNKFNEPNNIGNIVHIENADYCIFTNNIYSINAGDGDYALYLEGTPTYNIISENHFDPDIDTAQIYLTSTAPSNVIVGNENLTISCGAGTCTYGEYEITSPIVEFAPRRVNDEIKTADYVITTDDLGKTLIMNSADNKTFSLPSVGATEDGSMIFFTKIGAGKLTIDAADTDYIQDSGAGDGIYNDAGSTYASITLRYSDTDTRWYILDGKGTWVTYD